MKITAEDILQLGVADTIIPEPTGGAHRDPAVVFETTRKEIRNALADLSEKSGKKLQKERREKFLAIGRNL
jgi:acetyl-CoA carboxylase carboxyl transferase subunit alpha